MICKTTVLKWQRPSPSGDTWQYLETFLVVTKLGRQVLLLASSQRGQG